MIRKLMLLAASLALASPETSANMSITSFKAGGLVMEKTAQVAIAEEDLHLSPFLVSVRYLFRNRTDRPITTRGAFPLPTLDVEASYNDRVGIGWLGHSGWNPVEFSVRVDGRPLEPSINVRAKVGKREVSAILRQYAIPPTNAARQLVDRMDTLSPQERDALIAQGVLRWWEEGRFASPNWQVTLNYHWTMEFAPGRDTEVEISYRPLAGGATMYGEPSFDRSVCLRGCEKHKPFIVQRSPCRSDPDTKRLQEMYRTQDSFASTEFGYVLKTGRNWAGPIGRFRLTLDTVKPDAVLDLCPASIRKRLRPNGPAKFVFEAENFMPPADIDIGLYTNDFLDWPD